MSLQPEIVHGVAEEPQVADPGFSLKATKWTSLYVKNHVGFFCLLEAQY